MARASRLKTAGLIGVPVAFILIFFIIPLAIMAVVSVAQRGEFGGVQWNSFTTDAYVRFFYERDFDDSLIWNPAYAQILLRSVWLSLFTTVLCVVIGFPTALYMAMQPPPRRSLLIFLVTIPFWTNLLVRNYAWILMLRSGGLIDSALQGLGLTTGSLNLMYTETAIAIGLTYSFLPFMVLPIYSSLEKLDFRLVEAAYDLGADKWRALRRIVIPLAMPGVAAGAILVFIPCLGAYVTPDLLGGSKSMMIGNLIQNQFGSSRNWPFGAALSFALLAIVLLAMMLYLIRFRGAPQVAK
ncbi:MULTISPECIES: ABC transporter permease [Inquilinus]|uniref:Spermidine/putrescine transport system permease protein n=1 Tax=Inquilinus ginsengisoli TaxID=363840 RepID=A0ABU1JTH7_9PROT|nr:ABC transporter permease [Inquilinus ginsengisoli]MDR6291284.1 spermidine/putrescine transport system permease protein [Inquilinus ginsengisoli]